MREIEKLRHLLDVMGDELNRLESRKANLKKLLSRQGYSLKTIKGNRYLYVWTTTGHGKAKWKCLGNVEKKPDLVERLRDKRLKEILEEIKRVEEEEEKLRRRLEEAYRVLSG